MKLPTISLVLALLVPASAMSQAKTHPSKAREVLALYDDLLTVNQKLEKLDSRSQEFEKELKPLLDSDSALNKVTGMAIYVGALKAWIPEIKDAVSEEDSLIEKLVGASTGLTGDAARYADEGVRLLREQQVYLRQSLAAEERLVSGLMDFLRSLREDRVSDLPQLWEGLELDQQLNEIDDASKKQELTLARAKDAFVRLKATLK